MLGPDPPARPWRDGTSPDDPTAMIVVRGARGDDRGILAVWRAGRVVWSADAITGGPPYYETGVPPERVTGLLPELRALGEAFTAPTFYYGPDARWTNIRVFDGPRVILDLGSWHELYETRPNLVATATGVETLGGRSRSEVLNRQSAEYRAFRELWDRVKSGLLALAPPVAGARISRDPPW